MAAISPARGSAPAAIKRGTASTLFAAMATFNILFRTSWGTGNWFTRSNILRLRAFLFAAASFKNSGMLSLISIPVASNNLTILQWPCFNARRRLALSMSAGSFPARNKLRTVWVSPRVAARRNSSSAYFSIMLDALRWPKGWA